MKVAIELLNGRKSPAEVLNAWGTQGPVFLIDYVHVTYLANIRLCIDEPA